MSDETTSQSPVEPIRPSAWVISAQHWPRACIRAELIERGFEATGYETLADALSAWHDLGVARADAVVVDLSELAATAEELAELAGTDVSVILLAGASDLRAGLAGAHAWATVLHRPLAIGEVADIVERVTKGSDSTRRT